MATNYPVGDFLIRVKNAALAGRHEAEAPLTKGIKAVAEALKRAGYVEEVKVTKDIITATIAFRRKKPIMMGIKLVSKPGLRIYMDVDDIEKKRGPSLYLVSTPKGILTTKEVIAKRASGEVLAEVW
jgi:small subunit ribosomal protein S8